ncbi:hypothetical protein [Nocardiopsis metallicus]|uniref:Uncharacterized protein n=1 Tax=Nocardiopsis metallicus TaxID=179819 RepID=A0A840WTX1_9ACTN|nr:hypothetical protein [Nocardiopsis metallicus]MBB5493598.1 hypothetical protein [Nocardiopsis metallicus]
MSGNNLNLQESSAFGENSQATMDNSDEMSNAVRILISEIETLSRAIDGPVGDKLKNGIEGLTNCFNDLLGWCIRNGMNMSDAHQLLGQTEHDSMEILDKETSKTDALTRSVNA